MFSQMMVVLVFSLLGSFQDGKPVAQDVVVVKEAASGDNFHRALIQAAVKQVRDGKMKRGELIRLRVAMLSPAFREQAEALAVVQMSASGSDAVPMTPEGAIDRAAIDWDKLASFLERLIPIILQLIKAFSIIPSGIMVA